MTDVSIIGWSHSVFGKAVGQDLEDLISEVVPGALEHAGVTDDDVDGVFVGMFNSGMSKQDFPSSLTMQSAPGLRYKPAVRSENACASGSAAIHAAMNFIKAGRGRIALVVGVEKMTDASTAQVQDNLLGASYRKEEDQIDAGFAGQFGKIAQGYFQKYGDQSEALANIAAKNHRNGVDNPFAHMRKDLGLEYCLSVSDRNPFVAPPLKRSDCSLISDGAAALVLADAETAANMKRAVAFRSAVHIQDMLPMSVRDLTQLHGARRAWTQALGDAGVTIDDISFAEVHDCFTIAELMTYEAMGLAPVGGGAQAILEGWTAKDGKLPVNRSGGLKSKGHPIGATGVSMHAIAASQLCGEAGDIQLPKANLAGVFNMGGAAVANYVSVLERTK